MQNSVIIISILIMAAVTYMTRAVPLLMFRKKVGNRFLQSFLVYMPYGVLAAMVFPSIIYSTESIISALLGMTAALVLAFFKRGLLTVALISSAVVFISEFIMRLQ